ncbi:unnamed protein product, partial [Sphacelaria rigidula]
GQAVPDPVTVATTVQKRDRVPPRSEAYTTDDKLFVEVVAVEAVLFAVMPYSAVLIAAAFSLCLHWDRSSVLAIQATEATLSTDSVPKESSGTAASSAVKREVAAAVRWDVAAEEPSSGTFTKHSDDTVVESKPSILVENDDGEATSLPSLLTSPSIKNVPERPPPTKRKGSATTVTGNRSGAAANPPRTSTAASATKYRGAEG